MFTIKHVDPFGNEFAIEAESYFVEFDHPANLVRITASDKHWRDGNYIGLWAGVPCDHGGPNSHTIYVMNSKGSTIAKHHFTEQPTDGAMQADPALLQAA